MRQAIAAFAASVTPEGLTRSRFPVASCRRLSLVSRSTGSCKSAITTSFSAILRFSRSFLPRIDGVLDFFESHIDSMGLVSGMPEDVWQYVDWVTAWGATGDHPDKGAHIRTEIEPTCPPSACYMPMSYERRLSLLDVLADPDTRMNTS